MLIKNLFKYWTYQVFAPGAVLREKYDAFKSLLAHDKRAHELIAQLEEIYYHQLRVDFSVIEAICDELSVLCLPYCRRSCQGLSRPLFGSWGIFQEN